MGDTSGGEGLGWEEDLITTLSLSLAGVASTKIMDGTVCWRRSLVISLQHHQGHFTIPQAGRIKPESPII